MVTVLELVTMYFKYFVVYLMREGRDRAKTHFSPEDCSGRTVMCSHGPRGWLSWPGPALGRVTISADTLMEADRLRKIGFGSQHLQ